MKFGMFFVLHSLIGCVFVFFAIFGFPAGNKFNLKRRSIYNYVEQINIG